MTRARICGRRRPALAFVLAAALCVEVVANGEAEGRLPFALHFHKAGGSSLCRLAVQNGLGAAGVGKHKRLGFNCNILGDDPGHLGFHVNTQASPHGQAEGAFTCDKRLAYMREHGLGFSAVERWLFPPEICVDRFVYVTVLRDPITRVQSSVRFHRQQSPQLALQWATHHSFSSEAPISNGSPSVDNFYVRTLAGRAAYTRPLGHLTDADLTAARRMLAQFEVVMILEHLDRDVVQLPALLGWRNLHMPHSKRNKRHVDWTNDQLAVLTALNRLDLDLYAFADARAANISARVRSLRAPQP